MTGVTALAAGGGHTVALREDGTAWAWGDNGWGQLGDGTNTQRNMPVQVVGLTGVTALAADYELPVVLRDDGIVRAWGEYCYGQLGDETFGYRPTPVQVTP